MLNRITFLRCEEAKLDKNIEKAKQRVQECLSHKAARTQLHDDIALAVQDVLGTLQSQQESRGELRAAPSAPIQLSAQRASAVRDRLHWTFPAQVARLSRQQSPDRLSAQRTQAKRSCPVRSL